MSATGFENASPGPKSGIDLASVGVPKINPPEPTNTLKIELLDGAPVGHEGGAGVVLRPKSRSQTLNRSARGETFCNAQTRSPRGAYPGAPSSAANGSQACNTLPLMPRT